MPAHYLADKSALARLPHPPVDRRLTPLLLKSWTSSFSSAPATIRAFTSCWPIAGGSPRSPSSKADFDRAIEVMGLLSRRGKHRAAGIPDLLIAAVAERAGLRVLHYDRDFDLIASVTDQEVEWIVPAGSMP